MWFDILKMPNPYGGRWAGLSREQYYQMDKHQQMLYHTAMTNRLHRLMKTLRARNQPFGASTEIIENELRALREKRNFHARQRYRYENDSTLEIFFDIADENNREMQRHQTTPMGNPLEDLTEEEYNDASREDKMKYHYRRYRKGIKNHAALRTRMETNPNYVAPYNPKDANIKPSMVRETKEEYENMDIDEKRKYHRKLRTYYRAHWNLE